MTSWFFLFNNNAVSGEENPGILYELYQLFDNSYFNNYSFNNNGNNSVILTVLVKLSYEIYQER